MDVAKPKKTSTSAARADGQRIIVQSRPIIDSEPSANNDSTPGPTTAPTLSASKKVIVPISSDEAEAPKRPVVKDEPKEPASQPPNAAADPAPAESAEEAEERPVAPNSGPEPEAEDEQETSATPSDDDKTDDAEDSTVPNTKKPSAETQKAVEEAEKAAAREREVEEYIEKHQFFVPINAVARKRSVKVSAGLTVLVLLLAVMLIDLMLDSGVILLVQKIPHTHFFTTSSTNE